jgi:hypothetical protein
MGCEELANLVREEEEEEGFEVSGRFDSEILCGSRRRKRTRTRIATTGTRRKAETREQGFCGFEVSL